MAVEQAVGSLKGEDGNIEGVEFLTAFLDEAVQSGTVQELIDKHGVTGKLTVARRE